jgi:hypothetical protein
MRARLERITMMGMRHFVIGTLACSLVAFASSARADGGPRYGLSGGLIAVTTDAGTEHVVVDCKQTFALAQSGPNLFVACGEEGVATYSLADPMTPVFTGRVLVVDGPCVWLTSEGICMTAKPHAVAPVSAPPVQLVDLPPQEERVRQSDGLFIGGLTIVGVGAAMMFGGLAGVMSSCFVFCSPSEQSSSGAWAAVMLSGLALGVVVGMPMAVIGGHRVNRVSASIGPTGGSLRVTF